MTSDFFDCSTLESAQLALAFLSNILESSTEHSVIGKDLKGNIVFWNEGARRLYGYEREEVVGKANSSILHTPEDIENGKPREMLEGALREGRWEGEICRRRKNGKEFTARVVVTPRLDITGNAIGFLLMSRDISDEIHLAERTAQLETTNRGLHEQIVERRKVEEALMEANREVTQKAETMRQNAVEIKRLIEMSELLHSCVSSEEARQITEQSLRTLFPTATGAVYLGREFGGLLETFAAWNSAEFTLRAEFDSQECWAIRRGRPHFSGGGIGTVRCAHLQSGKDEASICIPMLGQGQSLGVLHMSWNPSALDSSCLESRERLVEAAADTIYLAIANVRLREKLKDQTIRDPLTKLYNRRYLEDSLNREISRARRAGSCVGIIMIDVDNFKQFNDSFGHLIGDELLCALGTYLMKHLRAEDIPSRFGGEEFTLILPGASCNIVRSRAETLRTGFRNIELNAGRGAREIITTPSLSFGVAVFPEHGHSVDEIMRAADEALYEAKISRDCVMVAGSKVKATPQTEPQAV